jgi:hypothetical protein
VNEGKNPTVLFIKPHNSTAAFAGLYLYGKRKILKPEIF